MAPEPGGDLRRFRLTWMFLLFIPGAALFGFGYVLDQSDWTANHGITANIYAAFTTGFFAVPIAANIIQGILRRDATDRLQRQIYRNARAALSSLRMTIESLGVEHLDRLISLTATAASDLSLTRLNYENSQDFKSRALEAAASMATLQEALSANEEAWMVDPLACSALSSRWRFLTDTLMPQAEIENIRLLPEWLSVKITTSLSQAEGLETGQRVQIDTSLRRTITGLRMLGPHAKNYLDTDVTGEIFSLNADLAALRAVLSARSTLYKSVAEAQVILAP